MKNKKNKFLHKPLSIILVVGVLLTSFSGLPFKIPKADALATVSGNKILEVARTYEDYTYENVGTCTGLVTRVLNKLGIGNSVVGTHPYDINKPQSTGGSKYSPDKMYTNAINHPEEAKLIWQGYVKDIGAVASKLKNGDLVIQRIQDKAEPDGGGHTAFIHKYGSTISMYGANGSRMGIGDAILSSHISMFGLSYEVSGEDYISVFRLTEEIKGTAKLKKVDYDSTKAQNEASLDGALYGLYAKNNIVSGDGTIVHRADTEITRSQTKNSEITVNNLYLGTYYWKEITPSKGYKLDPTKYEFTLNDTGQETIVVNTTVKEKVITGNFEIEKVITSGEESEVVQKEEGAEFIVVAQKYVDKYGTIEEAWKHKKEFTDKEYDILVTDKKGYAKSKNLAYGSFKVKQIKGKIDTENVKDEWTFVVSKENQDTIKYIINNKIFTTYIKLAKKDVETGKSIILSKTKFKIMDLSTGKYITQKVGNKKYNEWTTNKNGEITLPLELKAGKYKLVELKSPDLYLINNEGVEFTVTNSNIVETDEDGDYILNVTMYDQPVKGVINVEKHGEVLTGVKQNKDDSYSFVYENKCLAGMVVEIKAREDIIDPADGSVLYKKGSIVDSVTTGNTCENYSSQLPLGKYTVEEKDAPQGMVLNSKKYNVDLTFKDEETAVIMETVSITNERQKVDLDVKKLDKENKTPIKGVVFGLYTTKDIILSNKSSEETENNILIKNGTLIEEAISDKNGNVQFKADLPLSYDGEVYFEIKEIEPLKGYYPNEDSIEVITMYQGQEKSKVTNKNIIYNAAIKNYILVNKVDSLTMKNIVSKDFSFDLCTDEECKNVVNTYYADQKQGTAFIDIRYGVWYIREASAPLGYSLSPEIVKVELSDDGLFINNNKVETDEDLIYSIIYKNSLLPVIQTGVDMNNKLYLIIGGISFIGIVILGYSILRKKKKI